MLELSAAAREHFEHPRNGGSLEPHESGVVGARVGEPISGDVLQLHLRVNGKGVIVAVRFKAYGCGWLVACGSLLTECVEGRTLVEAGHFRHHALVEKLDVPPAKLHCAVLAETALKAALRAFAAKPASTTIPSSIP
jgi:nitrogen fixation NifU-like protein